MQITRTAAWSLVVAATFGLTGAFVAPATAAPDPLVGVKAESGVTGPGSADVAEPAVTVPAPARTATRTTPAGLVPADVAKRRTPGGRVLALPLANKTYSLTSGWGPRCIPTAGASTFHYGLDMSSPDGAPIYAVAGGTVTHVVQPANGGSGYVTVRTVVDGVPTWIAYVHPWNPGKYVKVGDVVKVGQRIADVGASGPATGPHLHLEVWIGAFYGSGTSLDPRAWLESWTLPVTKRAVADRTSPAPSSCTYYSTSRLNLRTGSSTSTSVVATLDPNTRLWNKPGTKVNGFIPVSVKADGTVLRGWVHSDYISTAPSYHLAAATVVRASAVSTSKALFTAPAGASVAPGRVSGWWTYVTVSGRTGWVPTSAIAAGR